MTDRAVIECFAKVNLFLDVLCKRRDGYHNIETIFQSISLSDVIEIELARSGISIECDNPSIPTDESNLAFTAFHRFAEAVGYSGGIHVSIRKCIPAGSGLGGGSSNAAATLVALNHLLQAGMTSDRLLEFARDIGADVPFFVRGGLAAAWEIGERFEWLPPLPESFLVVAAPRDIMVSTKTAYDLIEAPDCSDPVAETLSECSDRLRDRVNALEGNIPLAHSGALGSFLDNLFEKPIFSRHPEVEDLKKALLAAGAKGALMSGSGSSVFGFAESPDHADAIKTSIEKAFECDCFVARTINRGWDLRET